MTFNRHQLEWLALVFFLVLVGIVFQQINTNLVEQGIASGDAFHNAAFYPRAVAFLILGAVLVRVVALSLEMRNASEEVPAVGSSELFRPVVLVVVFGLYLYLLGEVGYHLVTAPFIALIMFVCGERKILPILFLSLFLSFLIAFLFEKYLSIVLPGGVFSINIPW